MNTDEKFARILDEMQDEQRLRDNARNLYAALVFCKCHLEEANWSSEEARLESLDMALRLCDTVLDRCDGVNHEHG